MTSWRRALGLALLVAGAALLVWSAAQGDLKVGLFLVVPYVHGTGLLPFLGFVALLAGAFLALAAGFRPVEPPLPSAGPPREEPSGRTSRHGGFALVGPIPIVWGNDRRLLPWLVLLGLALMVLALALSWLL